MLLLGRCGKRTGIFPPKLLIKTLTVIDDTENRTIGNSKNEPEPLYNSGSGSYLLSMYK